MTDIAVVGGVYHERCVWPVWDQLYGSAGRAAAAMSGKGLSIGLHSYATPTIAKHFQIVADHYGFEFFPTIAAQTLSFDYVHPMATPTIKPSFADLRSNDPIEVSADVVLRFGMLEGSGKVQARRCVYDPQSAFKPDLFQANGSNAEQIAIVANAHELMALGMGNDPVEAGRSLLGANVTVIVAKLGAAGAQIITRNSATQVPAFRTDRVFSIGSGDVFAATFTAEWGVRERDTVEAATIASKAVASYVETMGLPTPPEGQLAKYSTPAERRPGRVYLASPFFTLGQRWLVDETRERLRELGLEVFSPVHDVGHGPAVEVAPKDLAALDECDAVFAILDGLDSGTIFEIGYARAKNIPVYSLAQAVSDEDLKMISGSDCKIFGDFVTALHHTAWRT